MKKTTITGKTATATEIFEFLHTSASKECRVHNQYCTPFFSIYGQVCELWYREGKYCDVWYNVDRIAGYSRFTTKKSFDTYEEAYDFAYGLMTANTTR